MNNNQVREWHNRALEAEAAVEEGIDLVRDLLREHYLEMREAQANAFQIICQVALQAPTADDATGEHPSILVSTINRQLDTIRDQEDRIDQLEQLNVIAHDKQRELETDIALLREQLELLESDAADAREESSDVIRKCNEQLAALAAAAKLRDQQVETLARLWLSAFELTGSPVGAVITRQLYRVMADHGIDVSSMPDRLTTDTCDCA